jgi:hypothetical protein
MDEENVGNPLINNIEQDADEMARAEQERIQRASLDEALNRPEIAPKFSDDILRNFTLLDLRIKENQTLSPNHLGVVYYKLDDDGKTVIYNQDKYLINDQEELAETKDIIKSSGAKTFSSKKTSWLGGNKYTRRINKHSKTKKQLGSYLENRKSQSKHKRSKTHRK